MTSYKSQPIEVAMSASAIYNRIYDFSKFEELIDKLPEEVRSQLGEVKFTADSIVIPHNMLGQITLRVSERVADKRIAMQAENAPIPMFMAINLDAKGDNATDVQTSIDVDIPAMLKPMIGPKIEPMLKQSAEKFGEMIANIVKI
jgi:hypothetical protein